MIVATPDEEVVVALGLPQDARVVAGVQAGLVLGLSCVCAVVALAPVHDPSLQLELDIILLDTVNLKMAKSKNHRQIITILYPVEMTVETILTCILFATLRTDNVSVLVLEMDIFDVSLQGHLMEI